MDTIRNDGVCAKERHRFNINMMPLQALMERMCSPASSDKCEAPAAIFLLHNGFINLVNGSVGFHRLNHYRNDNPLLHDVLNNITGWQELPWTTGMRRFQIEHAYHPLLEWLQRNTMDDSHESIHLDNMPFELRILLQQFQQLMQSNFDDGIWNMLTEEDFFSIDWEKVIDFAMNDNSVNKYAMSQILIKNYGFGSFDIDFFANMSLNFRTDCRYILLVRLRYFPPS